MPETTPAEPGTAARRARWAVTAYFVVSGFALATWTARIPTIKQDLGLDDGGVTLALFAVAAGSVLAMQVCGHLTDRFGSARVVPPAGVLVALSGLAPGLADGLGTLVAGLVVFGAAHGTIDVAMNSHAVRVEQRYRRPIMSTFHATFSLGGLLGAGSGALAAHLGVSPAAHFALTGAVLLALSLLARPALLPPEPAPPAADGPRVRGFPMAIVFLGALGFFCSVGEGSMADWSSVYLHDELGTGTGFAALGYAVFSATMGLFRFLGDGLVRRFGPVPLVRVCGVVAGSGLGVALLLHHRWRRWAGSRCSASGCPASCRRSSAPPATGTRRAAGGTWRRSAPCPTAGCWPGRCSSGCSRRASGCRWGWRCPPRWRCWWRSRRARCAPSPRRPRRPDGRDQPLRVTA
ncbi:MFS transporter [Saccharopolyspora gregorii]|uniref:MFS transporter n=1 Tax=Saccharopolyspora gregorii TaxID=33914 RepID=A0ABP6RJU9_9PSEU